MNVWRTAFTSADNQSTDIGRVLWAFCVVALVCLETWSVVVHQAVFDAMAFAGAAGTILTTGGASLLLKHVTEPK